MFQHIIFDLDGTLWNTSESYLYAYKKLCEIYPPKYIQPDDKILQYLGVPLMEVIQDLNEFDVSKEDLALTALQLSIEYILKHPQFLSSSLEKLFLSLTKEFEVSIVSNCPNIYLETFFKLSLTKKYVSHFYTIEDGPKEESLRKITNNYQEKAIYIADSYEDYLAIKDHKRIVFCYASYGYKVSEEYDYKINSLEEITQVLPKIFYKEKILENVPYEIFSVKDSNCTVMYKDMICYFGFLETSTLENDCRLIEKLKKISKPLLGPMNGNTWYSYRISLNEFDFRLYPDCINDQTLLNLFLVAGFVVKDKYSSTLATINERIWERGKKIQLNSSYRIVQVHHEECYKYLDELYEVASLAFQNASYYEPISKEEFKTLYIKNIQLCQPDLVLIYYKESLVAFNFCYEDLEKRFYVCKTTAILPEHRSMKIILKLIDVSYQMMCSYGYKQVLYHFQNDQTKTLYPIFKDHILKQKFYGLLRYPYEK